MDYCLTLLTFAVVVHAQVVAAEKPTPDGERIERLVNQLGAHTFSEREAASSELFQVGEASLNQLIAAAGSEDPEVAQRAYKLYVRLKLASMRKPTLVSLTGEGVEARAVFEEISRQAKTPVYFDEGETAPFNNAQIDVEFDKTPYWEAFLETCRLSQNTCQEASPDLRICAGTAGLEQYSRAGPVLVRLIDVRRQYRSHLVRRLRAGKVRVSYPCLEVTFDAFYEGKMAPNRCTPGIVRSCETDAGPSELLHSMTPTEPKWIVPQTRGIHWTMHSADVAVPPGEAICIERLTGDFDVLLTAKLPHLPQFTELEGWLRVPFVFRHIPLSP